MKMAIAVIILLAIVAGVIAFMVFMLRKINNNTVETSVEETTETNTKLAKVTPKGNEGPKTAQDLLLFDSIKDNLISLGNHRYRVVLEVSSVNYELKTEKEKEVIEMSYQKFLNGLNFPIAIFCQTRIIDNSKMLLSLKEDIVKTIEKYPSVEEYGNIYYEEMKKINTYTGNNKSKRKFIVVSFEDVKDLTEFTEEEKYEEAKSRIFDRATFITEGLAPVGLKAKQLNTKELIELVYSSYNKHDISSAELISTGEYLEPIVVGENKLANADNLTLMDYILFGAQNEIKNKLLNKEMSEGEYVVYSDIVEHLDGIRSQLEDLAD